MPADTIPDWALQLPAVNAGLNSLSALLLCSGFAAIRAGKRELHRKLMVGAFTASAVFLASYLTYHYLAGSKKFTGEGIVRTVYFSILLTHTILAMVILPLILRTFYLAGKGRYEAHRRIARYTLPLWLYVSVTGVIVYVMLYQLYP